MNRTNAVTVTVADKHATTSRQSRLKKKKRLAADETARPELTQCEESEE